MNDQVRVRKTGIVSHLVPLSIAFAKPPVCLPKWKLKSSL
jgi:hypothetical protein